MSSFPTFKSTLNTFFLRALFVILGILVPLYFIGVTWTIANDLLDWTGQNWIVAAIVVVVVYQRRQIHKLEQEVTWLWEKQQRTGKHAEAKE